MGLSVPMREPSSQVRVALGEHPQGYGCYSYHEVAVAVYSLGGSDGFASHQQS